MENLKYKNEFNSIIKFIKEIRDLNYKRVGIITDKDGTIILNEDLKKALKNLRINTQTKIWLIANSGRTVGDMIGCLENEKIPVEYFDYIIGDNGGMSIIPNPREILYKSCIKKEISENIIKKFVELGGTLENIRIANGEEIYAQKTKNVKNYYKQRKSVLLKNNIAKENISDITKVTLTGSEKLIDKTIEYINENYKEIKAHKGKSSFPLKSEDNYRIDVTGDHDKGKATQIFRKKLDFQRCIFLGNDLNDLSMFYNAAENNDYIVISENEENKIAQQLKEKVIEYTKEKQINFDQERILIINEKDITRFLDKFGFFLRKLQQVKQNDRQDFMEKIKAKQYKFDIKQKPKGALRIKEYELEQKED